MLEQQLPDLRRCAACHDQCQFATLETFAGGSMVFDTSRKAAMLIAIAEGKLELTERAIEVIYSGLSSGIQHSVCVYQGDVNGWPDEAVWLRTAREELVSQGRAPAWAVEARDAIVRAAADASGPVRPFDVAHLRGHASATLDPEGHAQLAAIAGSAGTGLGLIEGETGFEPFDLGFSEVARDVASALHGTLEMIGSATVVCDSPEAVWMIREVWPGWGLPLRLSVVHTSEWIASLGLGLESPPPPRATGFHDPASLARGLDIVDLPREVLSTCGADLIEFPRSGTEALPVGGYYGAAQGDWVAKLAAWRVASAKRLGMAAVVVASPYDLGSFTAIGISASTLHGFVSRALGEH